MPGSVQVSGGEDLRRISARLRAAGRGDLRKELNKGIREATKPLQNDLKRAAESIESKGSRGGGGMARAGYARSRQRSRSDKAAARAYKQRGLRRTISRAIGTKITTSGFTTGVRVRVELAKLPPDQRALPRLLDGGKPWRHPVFGNRDNWVSQTGTPWFWVTTRPHRDRIRREVDQVLVRIANRI